MQVGEEESLLDVCVIGCLCQHSKFAEGEVEKC